MPSIINSDDGVVSGTSGIKSTGGNDGILVFQSSGTETARITAAGNVGIGTNNPSQKLTVAGNQQIQGTNCFLYLDNGGVGGSAFKAEVIGSTSVAIGSDSNHPLLFKTNSAERMRITSAGDVGIGTSSPAVRLDIKGSSTSAQIRFAGSGSTINRLYGDDDGIVILSADTGNTAASSYMAFQVDGSERMRITSAGDIGIGTSSPVSKLYVYGDSADAVSFQIENNNIPGGGSSVKRMGFVMGGTSAFGITGWQNTGVIESAVSGGLWLGAYNGPIKFAADSSGRTERARITSSGNFGIGTPTPSAPLSLASSYKQDGSAGNSFDVFYTIATIPFKLADISSYGSAGNNANAELTLAIGTDLLLGPLGNVQIYTENSNDSRVASLEVLKPTGYTIAARVIVVGDANVTGDGYDRYVRARSSVDAGTTWYNFDMGTGYRHQFYNARHLMVGKWMPLPNDINTTHGGICYFGVRSASTYGLVYTSISVQIAYVKL